LLGAAPAAVVTLNCPVRLAAICIVQNIWILYHERPAEKPSKTRVLSTFLPPGRVPEHASNVPYPPAHVVYPPAFAQPVYTPGLVGAIPHVSGAVRAGEFGGEGRSAPTMIGD
jgi:hypothetical protein